MFQAKNVSRCRQNDCDSSALCHRLNALAWHFFKVRNGLATKFTTSHLFGRKIESWLMQQGLLTVNLTSTLLSWHSSSPWKLILKPYCRAAFNIRLVWSTSKTPFSQNTSMFSTCKTPWETKVATCGNCFWMTSSVASSAVLPLVYYNLQADLYVIVCILLGYRMSSQKGWRNLNGHLVPSLFQHSQHLNFRIRFKAVSRFTLDGCGT